MIEAQTPHAQEVLFVAAKHVVEKMQQLGYMSIFEDDD